MLGGILPMVLQGLVKAELSVSSVSTLKRICRECRHDLGPYAQDILSVSQVRLTALCFCSFVYIGVITKHSCPSAGRTGERNPQGELTAFNTQRIFPCLCAQMHQPSCMMCAVCVPVCLCAEQPVHVVDAGSGFPPVRPAGRGGSGQTSLSHHSSRPAAGYSGPAGGTSTSSESPRNTQIKTVTEGVAQVE